MNYLSIVSYLLFPRFAPTSSSIFSYVSENLFALKERTKFCSSPVVKLLYIAFPYQGDISDLLDRVKLGGEYDIAYELGQILAERVWSQSSIFLPTPDLIVPVPSDPKRVKKRGFHVASILADSLMRCIKKDNPTTITSNLLIKTKHTQPQSKLKRKERKRNVKGVYSIYDTEVPKSKFEVIWLVDDIVASQSTISECADVIHQKFPDVAIYAVVLSGN